ncbi:asparaginase [Paenibacillus aurantius]|uniref:Asparaginase n=1 Tax=Paenibacillus aurantius TaxID=2918900 RepID=A0AA96LKW9_9BACL|nr:asparaginase [Paenibacillus aurantius]WNQ13277.1 asparaginase [Paenibacillus aurantius]
MTEKKITSGPAVLVEEYRGHTVENVHMGHICGVGANGKIQYAVGDTDYLTYLRSSGKPVQALPAIKAGVEEAFGLAENEVAVMAGSHRAEPMHVQALTSLMAKTGIAEEQLICLPTYPLAVSARDALIAKGEPPRRIYHNCSGKHLGMISYCKHRGHAMESYADPDGPLQREIVDTLAMLAEMPADEVVLGTDGCGCPVFAIPLFRLATVYLKLAVPALVEDQATRSAIEKLTAIMNRQYSLVSGTNLICSTLLMDDNIVAKGGAKGVYCFGLRRERLGFALKVLDGSEEEWPLIVASILEQIGYDRQETIDRLRRLAPAVIRNDNNVAVGENRPVFQLLTPE